VSLPRMTVWLWPLDTSRSAVRPGFVPPTPYGSKPEVQADPLSSTVFPSARQGPSQPDFQRAQPAALRSASARHVSNARQAPMSPTDGISAPAARGASRWSDDHPPSPTPA
jgi:hypothetical protein